MTQEIEDIEFAADPLGLTEPENLFPDVLDAEPTPAAKVARDLVKVDLRAAALARFGDWRAGAAAVLARVKGKAYDNIQTPAGLKEATADRAALRDPRLKAQKVAEATKKQLRSVAGDVGTELETIVATLKPEEERIGAIIAAENERREEAARQKAAAEADRQRAHEENIAKICTFEQHGAGRDVPGIQQLVDTLAGITIVDDEWQEYAERARAAVTETIAALKRQQAEITRAEAENAEQARAAAATRERELHLQEQADALAQQKAALEAQQRAMTRLNEWAALPAQLPTPGAFTVAQLEEAVVSLAAENPDATTFGAMLPVALIAHSTALAHARGLVDLARRRDFAEANVAAADRQIEEARAFGPPDTDGVLAENPKAEPPLEPSSGHVTASRSGTTTTSWNDLHAPAAQRPAEAAAIQEAAQVIVQASTTAFQAQVIQEGAKHALDTEFQVEAIDDRGPATGIDPATALLNMGAINERFEFTLTRDYVENTLKIPPRREERRASFWTEDDYLLIAARIAIRMEEIVAKGLEAAS